MIAQTFSNAWSIYRARFGLIAAIVATIWIPCNLADSYLTYFVIDPDDFLTQFKLTVFLENFIAEHKKEDWPCFVSFPASPHRDRKRPPPPRTASA